jgi:DNA-binding NarL/FixJ family response regulator
MPVEAPQLKAIRVVLVDDSADFLAQARDLVASTPGLQVAGAVMSAAQALLLLSHVPADLVLMDLRLPGMDGLEATRHIKAQGGGTPRVVIVSLHDGPEYRRAAQAAGADGFIAKADLGASLARGIAPLFATCKVGA